MAMMMVKYHLYVDLYQLLTNGYDDEKKCCFLDCEKVVLNCYSCRFILWLLNTTVKNIVFSSMIDMMI